MYFREVYPLIIDVTGMGIKFYQYCVQDVEFYSERLGADKSIGVIHVF